jgi:hypothetical protein
MFSRLFLSATNSSNLILISSHTPITTKTMVVVVNGWNMRWEKLRMVSFDKKNETSQKNQMTE